RKMMLVDHLLNPNAASMKTAVLSPVPMLDFHYGGPPPAMCFWPQNTECLIQEGSDAENSSPAMSSADQEDVVVPASLQTPSNVNPPKDFIRCLPLHLSMYILALLDQKSLKACAAVSRCWAFLAKEVKRERVSQSLVQEKILYLQLNEEGYVMEVEGHNWISKTEEEETNLQAAYHDLQTDTIQLEERNVFCGSYNIRVLTDQSDRSRIIHYSGGNLVAIGSADRKVRLLGMSGMKEVFPPLSGHAGSIKALFLNEKKGFVLSASFDLSIRCWNIYSGACVKIFNGHCGTITCLDLHEEQFVSGARDGMVKVWNLESGKCLKTLKHSSAVWVVKMDGTRVVSGCDRGLVKVWCAATGTLIKTLEGHQGPVKCLSFDQWHLVTGSTDGYALGWSMLGNLKRCLIAFRHPKEVLSLEFLYLRVISGCADGKIRIFNYLTGSCLKVLMANSRGDPISSFYVAGNRMVINSPTSLLMFQFEDVRWDYTLEADRETSTTLPTMIAKTILDFNCILFLETDGKSEHGPSLYAPARADRAEATLQHVKRRGPSCLVSPDKFLLTVSMLQNTCKAAPVRSSIKHTAEVREAWEPPWEPQQHRPEKVQIYKNPLQHKKDQTVQLQRVRLHSDSLTMKRISIPFETKMLQLKLKNSLHGPTVNSSIPAPSIVRPKTCGLLREKKAHRGHASSELIKSTRVVIAQMKNEAVSRRKKPFCLYAADSSQSDGGFRLLTGKQKEVYEAAAVAQYRAHQTKLTEDQQRARKKAWLRKLKGLPIDSFTEEGKTAAPEFGLNTFI
ncbi:PREDICTED: F-box/WD repeat-containing protein 10-like, partial [Phaethon lepturus]|uniref:F-box/WD repeat-containing protein 10-like n=1 Tax=Phaethon lepturus TaxID=97097 RepID=UPI0005305BE3